MKRTAIFVGAGAVEGSWAPIIKALGKFYDFPVTSDGANSVLARLVYLLRWFSGSQGEFANQELSKHLEILKLVKIEIISELRKSENRGEIRARPSLEPLINQLVIPHGVDFMLVTTNWDKVIDREFGAIIRKTHTGTFNPIHLHGSVSKLNTMYLPSEMTREPYRKPRDERSLGGLHGAVWRGLEKAHRAIIYGLSIDPLDAELGQTLAVGWNNPNLEEILIVDPNHGIVAHRINLLLTSQRDIRVLGLNPSTLMVEKEYTIWRHRSAPFPIQ